MASSIVRVVFDLESDPIVPLGTYSSTEGDSIIYLDAAGYRHFAPVDCVGIVRVEVDPVRAGAAA